MKSQTRIVRAVFQHSAPVDFLEEGVSLPVIPDDVVFLEALSFFNVRYPHSDAPVFQLIIGHEPGIHLPSNVPFRRGDTKIRIFRSSQSGLGCAAFSTATSLRTFEPTWDSSARIFRLSSSSAQ